MLSISEIRNLFQGVEYRNQPEALMNYMIEDDSITDGAYRLFQLIYKDGYFDDDFSISKSKQTLAEKLKTSESSIYRRLKELKKAGYINIIQQKCNNEYLPSRVSVSLPEAVVKILEEAPQRKKSNIKKCGTVDRSSDKSKHDADNFTDERGVVSPVKFTPYIYNSNKNNNSEPEEPHKGEEDSSQSNLNPNESVVVYSSSQELVSSSEQSDETDIVFESTDILANNKLIEDLESQLEPFREQLQDILDLRSKIGAMRMSSQLETFKKNNSAMLDKEIELAELHYLSQLHPP